MRIWLRSHWRAASNSSRLRRSRNTPTLRVEFSVDRSARLSIPAAPTQLAAASSGRYRYGVSGSMVEFVDQRSGRETIRKLLAAVTNAEAFRNLQRARNTIRPGLESRRHGFAVTGAAYHPDVDVPAGQVPAP